jgi:predicted MPP superfamily phosphohydrolase
VKLTRRTFLRSGLAASIGGLSYSTLLEPHRLSLERVTIRLRHLPSALDGFRIAVLTDFHLHPFTKIDHIQRAVQLANSLNPDLAVLLGDYIDSTVDAIHELAPELARLNARQGVFGVLGNHDYWKGPVVVRRALLDSGITVLQNTGVALPVGQSELFLAGLESAWAGHPDMKSALSTRRGNAPTVLLMHEPDYADKSSADGRISLQLSGHSHGGQVRLPLIGALELPSWGRRYDHGLYRVRDMQLYTNRGIGLVDLPVRFNCPPEVTEITLRPDETA